MSGESSKRSNLVDVTYFQLHDILSGNQESVNLDQFTEEYLVPRRHLLSNISEPFGKPSNTSKMKVESGSVTLPDGVVLRVENADKEFVFAVSKKFQIDEVQALVLLRSFLYNLGLPSTADTGSSSSIINELLEAITPFYHSERLALYRTLIPLFRANENVDSPIYEVASKFLPQLLPDAAKFAESVVVEYARKAREQLPVNLRGHPKPATQWAKQNLKEQLVLLEVLFWTMWGYVPCSGPMVETIYETMYATHLGDFQQNMTLLFDEESNRCVLELETVGEEEFLLDADQTRKEVYTAAPDSLQRIHAMVVDHMQSEYSLVHLAWSYVLSKLSKFFKLVLPQLNRYSKDREPAYTQILQTCLSPDADLFKTLYSLLTLSPLFVTSVRLIISLTELVPIESLPNIEDFVQTWAALFGRSERDWSHGTSRRALFDVTRSRFPVQPNSLVVILHAAGDGEELGEERDLCDRYVFHYFQRLPSYTMLIPITACQGAHALYERQQERYGSSTPGGSTLPARSVGRLLSGDGEECVIVCWQHEHSGWKFILELLTDYVNRKQLNFGASGGYDDIHIGVEMDNEGDDAVITDALDLVRSLIQSNPGEAEELMQALEAGDPVVAHTMTESQPPDLDALSRSNAKVKSEARTKLITSSISVLSALLALPNYSNRVWLYIRSTSVLFGSDRTAGFASVALAQLFREASSTLQQLKEEVLLRAANFVHGEIWVEHHGWKYAQLGDRFEIGRRVTSLYVEVLEHAPPALSDRPFLALSQAVVDVLLIKATTSTITPLVSSITSGGQMLKMLKNARRYSDFRRLVFLLESHLRLCRLILNCKQKMSDGTKTSLLEQSLCTRIAGGASSHNSNRSKLDPIDVLAGYVKNREAGTAIPLESMRVLYALCSSLSSAQPSPPSIIATVSSLVSIVQHPFDDLSLRNAIWNFISLAVDREPALASLFVTGRFRTPDEKGTSQNTAISVARDVLANWEDMWEANPELLASVMRFLDMVWQHGLEHKAVLEKLRANSEFWDQIVGVTCAEVGPVPDYETSAYAVVDGVKHSELHDAVSMHCYRTMVKSYAVHIIGLDIDAHRQLHASDKAPPPKPQSFQKIEPHFKSHDQLTDLLSEAVPSSYSPQLYDGLVEVFKVDFPGLTVEQLESQFGDQFAFSVVLLRSRMHAYPHAIDEMENPNDVAEKQLLSVNLNLSLSHTQRMLAESWEFLLRQVASYLRGDATVQPILLSVASSISDADMMATIHGTRLSLLLAILEVVWFPTSEKPQETQSFVEIVHSVQGIILNEAQSPASSFIGNLSIPFHRVLLQIVYFCVRRMSGEHRLIITGMIESALNLVIDALRVVLNSARTRMDVDLDRDLQLLVAVFEQSIKPDIRFLRRLTDVIRASLDLYVHIDLVGLTDMPLLLARKQPLYGPHILQFHMALASNHSAAERLASEGAGMVAVSIPELPGERSPAHIAYCSMVSIVAAVVNALGKHNHYFDAEACAFVQLYGDQISKALSWTIGDAITTALIEEIEQVVNLFYAIAASAPSAANSNPAVNRVLRVFTTHALLLVQQLNYAITHPNHIASLLEPVTNEERMLLEKEHNSSLVHRLFKISSNVIGTLVAISRAEVVLLSAQEDWPISEALIAPQSRVMLGEPASLGTLLELGNSTLDVLRELLNHSSSAPAEVIPPLDVRQGVLTARRNLESILLYSVTQLAMWLSKPENEHTMRMQRTMLWISRAALSLAERVRRGMTGGDLLGDLQALLTKTKALIPKSNAAIGGKVLLTFMHERILTSQ
ncbi:hypothetical protein BDQ17DRAFT_1354946 [Cyathus striatus]|nr:hypothetical protein BDQ17DRAFT_1354946 [Cyathus striatus]